jgi:hypothetical protein
MTRRTLALATALALGLALGFTTTADAGCGCQKPPPPLASIRPAFASPGDTVTLFAPGLEVGKDYTAVFTGSGGATASASARAVLKRDFADGLYKAQLVLPAPSLPSGPTAVTVRKKYGTVVLAVAAHDFTMLQPALALPEARALTAAACYRAAVGMDGTVYIPLNISAVAERMIFSGIGRSFPLLYTSQDIVIYNTQGVLMQLLGPEQADIFAILDPGAPDSFELLYDRHEFVTYRQAHLHENGYGLDPSDPAWHTDGTRHIDHDHLVIAIRGTVEGAGSPTPGQTPPFTLDIATDLPDGDGNGMSANTIQWSTECSAADEDEEDGEDGDDD